MERCIADVRNAVTRGRVSLEEQVRAYDLLDALLGGEYMECGTVPCVGKVEEFCEVYESVEQDLARCFDAGALQREAEALLVPLKTETEELRFEAASAASLHEFAKEVFDIWQTQGIFARKRALRELRERAGFRLESHRIGNYVAKTFDLMNEAQARFARAQQALFAADVRYKIRENIYGEIYKILCRTKN